MNGGGGVWSRKCTCAVETESDSDAESDGGGGGGEQPQVLLLDGAALASTDGHSNNAITNISNDKSPASSSSPSSLLLTNTPPFTRLPRKTSGVRDPITTSHALHNSEALRQAQALQNVFCACYESETVLSLVQKRERVLSPMQVMLLEPENIAQVFIYATQFPEVSSSSSGHHHHHAHKSSHHHLLSVVREVEKKASSLSRIQSSPIADPEKYRRPYIATEIIVRFYLKALTWHGTPKTLSSTSPVTVAAKQQQPVTNDDDDRSPSSSLLKNDSPSNKNPDKRKPVVPTAKPFLLDLAGSFRTSPFSRLGLGRNSSSGSSRYSDQSEASAAVRGYILHIEELTLIEWKRIFSGMYRFLWGPQVSEIKSGSGKAGTGGADGDHEAEIDSVLLANMCRITKNFAVYPSVHSILSSIEVPGGETLFARFAHHAYDLEVSSLLHGLIHLAQRRQYSFQPILDSLMQQVIDVPLEPSSMSQFNFRNPLMHARISGCADILVKILTQQFPNTFCYYIQTKLQLASYESVESFEREIFPPKVLPDDRMLHEQIKDGVMKALLEKPEIVTRLAEVSVAEIRYLDANHADGTGIPTALVIDVLKCAIEYSLSDKTRMSLFVPPVELVVETLCAAINYHQHISTITEFASRDCFSDSDSEDSQNGDGDDSTENVSRNDELQNQPAVAPRVLLMATSPTPPVPPEMARRQLQRSFIEPPATCISPSSGKRVINHRPLASILLAIHIVEFMGAIIHMGKDSIDRQLAKFDLATSLIDIFQKFPKANVLHCRIVKLYLNLFDRVVSNGRVNNPLLRSVFRPPESLLGFILQKLHKSSSTHPYDAHLAILGVKIHKICSSPRLEQELIRQYCERFGGWTEFSSSLVASHYQQIDALDDALLGVSALKNGGVGLHRPNGRRGSDGIDDVFPLERPSSSGTAFLSQELEPFRRLPMEKEGFGSPQNLATGNEIISPTDMFKSRSQSQYPQSIIDVMKADTTTSFDAVEDDVSISGFVYQKRSKWVKVHLRFEKESCLLVVEDAATVAAVVTAAQGKQGKAAGSPVNPNSTSKLKQFLMAKTQHWTSRSRKFVVCNARKWIAFGRSVKNPGIGAFGFQVEVFDRSREVDQTLTFVTRSDAMRTMWYEGMQEAMTASQTLRNSITEEDDEGNIMLVKCVATKREGQGMLYHVVPNVHLLGPVVAPTFFIKSEVPEELPFWGTFHGMHGIIQYASLLNRCVRVLKVDEKRMYASGYSVIVEFDATFQSVESADAERKMPVPNGHGGEGNGSMAAAELSNSVTCSCTDTYLITGNQIIGLTRTIADSEKLMEILSDYE